MLMKRLCKLAALVCLPITSMADPANVEAAAQVRCTEIAFSLAAENRDKDKFASLLDADTRFVGNSVNRGAQAVLDAWSGFFEEGGPEIIWRPQFVVVLESGDLALSRGPYRLRFVNDAGERVELWGTYNSVWRKTSAGQWRIIFDAGNDAAEPPPTEVQQLLEQSNDDCRSMS